MLKKILFALCSLYSVSSSAQYVFDRADINSGTSSSNPGEITAINNLVYFRANDGTNGLEPWISDGTVAGTKMLKDINTGGSSTPNGFTLYNGKVYFCASDGINGAELWVTDGTAIGTQMLIDINPGAASSSPDLMWVSQGKLFFRANNGINGGEPWVSDGTTAGTKMLKDIWPGSSWSSPVKYIPVGTMTAFTASDGTSGEEVWITDGTTAGTQMLKDFCTGSCKGGSFDVSLPYSGKIIYSGGDVLSGGEVMITDGTFAGTTLVKDINPVTNSVPQSFIEYKGKVYFSANGGTTISMINRELWVTDGTNAGTQLVKEIGPGDRGSSPDFLTVSNNKLFFTATDSVNGAELWVSDGTASGTKMVKDINTKATYNSSPTRLTSYKDKVYFIAMDSTSSGIPTYIRRRLYVSDGTDTGTKYIYPPGPITNDPVYVTAGQSGSFAVANGCMFFIASFDTTGSELWWLKDTTTTPPPGNVHTTTKQSSFKMYPNPAAHSVNISFYEKHNDAQLTIADITGKVVLQRKIDDAENNININISGVANGVYISTLKQQDRTETTRLVIQQ